MKIYIFYNLWFSIFITLEDEIYSQWQIYPRLRTTGLNLNSEMKYVKRTRLLNGYPKWMIQNKKEKQHNRYPEFIS